MRCIVWVICTEMDKGWTGMLGALAGEVVKYDNVESYTEVIKGVDGNDVTLYISKPKDTKGPAPCIFHTHGGGMVVRDKYHSEQPLSGARILGIAGISPNIP